MARICLPYVSIRASSLSIRFLSPINSRTAAVSFCSASELNDFVTKDDSKRSPLKPGLYLVGTPIGNLEDITLRQCVIAREITKLHEEFWRGSLGEAKQEFLIRQPKGEITLLIEGKEETKAENPTESQLEEELRGLISDGHSLSTAVKTVAERTSMRKKEVYSLALKKFGKQIQVEDEADE